MSREFDFDTQVKADNNKIDFAKVFFNPEQGLNIIRIVDLKKAQAFKSHFVKTAKGEQRFIKCPGAGCPICIRGGAADKPSTRYLLKVISRKDNTLKVWEFGSQIKVMIEEFVKEIKENIAAGRTDAADTLTDYNIELRRRAPKTNPLYAMNVKERLSTDPRHATIVASDTAVIAADKINLADLVKPWSVERIKTQILGLAADAPVIAAVNHVDNHANAPLSNLEQVAARTAVVAKPDLAALQAQVAVLAKVDDGDDWLK
jgi:hypothetical protein